MSRAYHMIEALHTPKFQPINTIVGLWTCPTCDEHIHDIQGALNISDDVIVFGKTQADHDLALQAVFQRFSEINLTLHKKKCEFNRSSITFFGFVFSGSGISPDPSKVDAIKKV